MKKWVILLIGAIFLAGCGKEQSYEPEEINPEIDVCEKCNMSVAYENYATEVISTDGHVYKFDDIGCMIQYIHEDKEISEKEIGAQYVRDVETGKWVDLEKAYHVYYDPEDEDYWTPMRFGVLSFNSKDAAEKYIEKTSKGELYDYDKLLEHKWEGVQ